MVACGKEGSGKESVEDGGSHLNWASHCGSWREEVRTRKNRQTQRLKSVKGIFREWQESRQIKGVVGDSIRKRIWKPLRILKT